jgi:glycerol-3-phosphate acyltransferase PlsY
LFLQKDIRSIGDGNPGTANAWKLGGHIPGITSLVLEIGKGTIPLYAAFRYLELPSTITSELISAALLLSPIIGHAWSPFLRFRGGKAIAVTGGAWIIALGWISVPIAILLLGLGHLTQRNHAITVTATLIGLLLTSLALNMHPHIFLFGIINLIILGYKHRAEYSEGIIARQWIDRVRRVVP